MCGEHGDSAGETAERAGSSGGRVRGARDAARRHGDEHSWVEQARRRSPVGVRVGNAQTLNDERGKTLAIAIFLSYRGRVRRVGDESGLGPCRDMSRYQVHRGFAMHVIKEKSANSVKNFGSRLAERPIRY